MMGQPLFVDLLTSCKVDERTKLPYLAIVMYNQANESYFLCQKSYIISKPQRVVRIP